MNNIDNRDQSKNYLINIFNFLISLISITFALYHLMNVYRPYFSPVQHENIHLTFALILIFLIGAKQYLQKNKWAKMIIYLFLLGMSLLSGMYIHLNFDKLIFRVGNPNISDTVIGIILIILVLEGTRKSFGLSLPILAIIAMIYARFGYLFPWFFYHGGFGTRRLIAELTTSLSGIFGIMLAVSASFLALFLMFGGLMESYGAGIFFTDIARLLSKHLRSGPAQGAVISSALMGTISGSAVANTATTGTFTIPLMKKMGYKSEFAGAVEAVASTGGIIMPPIMGAGAFIMSGMLGIPYRTIILAALIPAIIYFLNLGFAVHLRAYKINTPDVKIGTKSMIDILKNTGHFIIPIMVIVFTLIKGYTAIMAGYYGIISIIIVMTIRKSIENPRFIFSRISIHLITKGFVNAAERVISIASTLGLIGIIVHCFVITGLAHKVVFSILSIGGGNLYIALFLVALICFIFGMGVPTTAAYILVAILSAPAMIQIGIDPLVAHLFIYYFSMLACLTPPVGAASLVAANIAEANYYRTCFTATRLALPGFVLPFFFIFKPLIIGAARVDVVLFNAFTLTLGLISITILFESRLFIKLSIIEKFLYIVGIILAINVNYILSSIGTIIIILSSIINYNRYIKVKKLPDLVT